MEPVEVLAVLKMGNENAYHLLKPLTVHKMVSQLFIVRPEPPFTKKPLENTTYFQIHGKTIIHRFWHIFHKAKTIASRPNVKVIVSFNPVPYGLTALLVSRISGKPVHLGFVGSDWYRHGNSWYAPLLHFFLKRADVFTVTGKRMKDEMISKGYAGQKIFHLPHSIDLSSYKSLPLEEKTYDCIFVGAFIRRKRIDLILQAVSIVKKDIPGIRICLVGDGPLMDDSKVLTKGLGLEENIEFSGYNPNPENLYSKSKIVLIASDMEGFPYALVEGMVSGAIPVSTDVGTISDFINNGENGLLVPTNNPGALAAAIQRLLKDKDFYNAVRDQIDNERDNYSLEKSMELWTRILSAIENKAM